MLENWSVWKITHRFVSEMLWVEEMKCVFLLLANPHQPGCGRRRWSKGTDCPAEEVTNDQKWCIYSHGERWAMRGPGCGSYWGKNSKEQRPEEQPVRNAQWWRLANPFREPLMPDIELKSCLWHYAINTFCWPNVLIKSLTCRRALC